MAIISFSDDRSWVRAGWVVRRLLADMHAFAPDDNQVRDVIEHAIETQWLLLDRIEKAIATQLVATLKVVIVATLENEKDRGLTWDVGLDEEGKQDYKEGLANLLEMLPK